MWNLRKAVLALATFLFLSLPLVLAQGTYAQIDVPDGTNGTSCIGVNGAGDIVGMYEDAGRGDHGFLYSGGVYTTIDYPGAGSTELSGINDSGQVVGFTFSFPNVGFLYDLASQTFTTISFPGSVSTYPMAINNAGIIAGVFYDRRNVALGFELRGSEYRQIEPDVPNVWLRGITDSGMLAGYKQVGQVAHNFLLTRGKLRGIKIPHAKSAFVLGINRSGSALVGQYQPDLGPTYGFLFANKTLQQLTLPGSTSTYASGVNKDGETVGTFYDEAGLFHGFIWMPPAAAARNGGGK